MDVWSRRDKILEVVVNSGVDVVQFSELRRVEDLEGEYIDDLQVDLYWLGQREFIEIFDSFPGDISTVRAKRRGIDLVEHGISVKEISRPQTRSSFVNSQVNFNLGSAINIQGDGNNVNQNNESELLREIMLALYANGETGRAEELQSVSEKEGKRGALKTVRAWMAENVLAPAASAAIGPLVTQALFGS